MMRRIASVFTLSALITVLGCGGSDQDVGRTEDTTARDLTLAPAETTARRGDVPDDAPRKTERPETSSRRTQPTRTTPRPPPAPKPLMLATGSQVQATIADTISSRTNKPGEAFQARVSSDVKDASGRTVIPAGSVVNGTITEVRPAPNAGETGRLVLQVSSVSINGESYAIEGTIDSLKTVKKGRGVERADAIRTGAGAAAGAVLGRVIGKDGKGAVIGGIVGAATGAAVSAGVKDVDIVLPAGSQITVRLTRPLSVPATT
jgi:hypothetical protein